MGGTKQERDQHGQVWKSRGAPLNPAVGHGMGMEGGWEQELDPGTEEMSPWALIDEVGWGGWLCMEERSDAYKAALAPSLEVSKVRLDSLNTLI